MPSVHHVRHYVLVLAGIAAIVLQPGAPASASGSFENYDLDKIKDELDQKNWDELFEQLKDGAKAGEKWNTLVSEDDQYEPDYDPAGMPEIPAVCKDSAQCEQCFAKPYQELNNLRFRFEKLRKINRATKNMLRDSIEFADAMADVAGGVAPLVWAKEKEKARAAEKNFNASYDAKYEELLATLKATLQAIAACEEQVFGEPGWYERYGFMYYQFMAATYRRPE